MSKNKPIHTVIEAEKPWKPIDVKELYRYRDLFYFRVINGYRSNQRQTVLSYVWVLFDPAINIIFFTIVFGGLAKVSTQDPYIIFNSASLAGWLFLKNAINFSAQSMVKESILMRKIYYPRFFIPVTPIFEYLPNFLIQFIMILCVLAFNGVYPSFQILWAFPIVFIMMTFSVAIGLLFSSYMVQFRDLQYMWRYLLKFIVYLVPVAYPLSAVPEQYQF